MTHHGPRKVIVGTSMYNMFHEYPGLDKRLEELCTLIDDMVRKAKQKYPDRSLDLAALPEYAVVGGLSGPAKEVGVPLEGKLAEVLGAKAREHHCYVVVPLILEEDRRAGIYSNTALLFNRDGGVDGMYRKVHVVPGPAEGELEGGLIAGDHFPVFECDFGKIGIQICYDMAFDDGWEALGKKGAEIVVWPSQWPGQISAAARSLAYSYYLLSSTWRNNASLVDPTGHIIAQIHEDGVLVEEIDLEYAIVSWEATLREGAAFDDAFGDRAGYRYDPAEDSGIFWSNDPELPIEKMLNALKLVSRGTELAEARHVQDVVRGGPPRLD